jgi:Ras-related protein Rab-8A
MYGTDSQTSFEYVTTLNERILQIKGMKAAPILIVGNKADISDEKRAAVKQQGEELASRLNVPFFEASSKTKVGIEEPFRHLIREMKKSNTKPSPRIGGCFLCKLVRGF